MTNAREYYSRHSHNYVQKWAQLDAHPNSARTYYRRQLMDTVLSMSSIHQNSEVVEIGCGTGLMLREILEYTDRVFGVDIAEDMLLRVADSTLPDKRVVIVDDFSHVATHQNAEIMLMLGRFETLNLPQNYYDRLVSVEVLRYIDDIDTCFENCRAIMKEDSLFIFSITNFWSSSLFPIRHSLRKRMGLIDPQEELLQHFVSEKALRKKLLKAGFDVVGFSRLRFLSVNPLIRRWIRTRSVAAKLHALDNRLAKLPGIKNLFDTFVVAAKKRPGWSRG